MSEAFNWDALPVKVGATANPAAGAELPAITVPADKRWQFFGGAATLVATGVANRTVFMEIRPDGTNALDMVTSTTAQTDGTTRLYKWILPKTYGETLSGTIYIIGLGRASGFIELAAGATIVFTTANKQAGDDWTACTYWYKEATA